MAEGSAGRAGRRAATAAAREGATAQDAKKGKKGTTEDLEMDEKEKEKSKKGKGSKGRGKGKSTKHKASQADVAKALPILVKATCSTMQATRELEGTVNDTLLFEAAHNIPVAMKAATKIWQEAITEKGKGHGQGPPHLPAWEAFLATLKAEDVGGAAKLALNNMEEKFKQLAITDKLLMVRVCKSKITYDQNFSKVTLALRGEMEASRSMILEAAKQAGAEIKHGKAPPSGLERQLQQMLTQWAEAAEE